MRSRHRTVEAALDHLGCNGNVLTVDPSTLDEVLDSITTIGLATGRSGPARHLVANLHPLGQVVDAVATRLRPRVAVLEWTDPLFSAGHWVPDMVEAARGTSVLGASGQRSQPISAETLAASKPRSHRGRTLWI